ncbi:MAG: ABC transporter substrate-binding protein [Oscillospiraceae bacterium]|nr:ABC transporter substrate-binding protein [Oscillospiraceae bacterium]
MKKLLALLLAGAMALSMVACGGSEPAAPEAETGSVYYLNFKPEQDAQWQALAEAYTTETGVPVTVVTAASGEYETTLMAEMSKDEAPTLFQVNGPVGLANWKDYCYDFAGSDVYNELSGDSFALIEDGKVYGIAYVVETYGIIANTKLLEAAGYTTADIASFADLKAVAEDITARSAELGFAAFSSAGMDGSSDWRFKTHLANLPLTFEYQTEGITPGTVKGTYLDNYRAIWDLYINNSTCDPAELSAKTGNDAVTEMVEGKAVFYQNGTWAAGDLAAIIDDLTMIPLYIGVGDEANQGLCTGSENYWCVNSQASQADIDATLAFLNWCVTSETGLNGMCKEMGFVIPFAKALEADNKFVQEANAMIAAGKTPVGWNFPTMPSEEWKNMVGSALTAYAADQTDDNWAAVVKNFVDGWAAEYALANG